ncbi:MAG: hypothetical protein LUQ27_05375 [Methanomassiliicoccales archaeon]|nr:hypothetical protein [Methanomassiliicoccales archaeon]
MTDFLAAWYTVSYTTEDKAATVETTPYSILEVRHSSTDTLLIRSDDGVRVFTSEFSKYDLDANAVGMCIADTTDAVAIGTEDGVIRYYQPGEMSSHFSVDFDGSATPIGIAESFTTRGSIPDQLVLVMNNATDTSVVVLSVIGDGSVSWRRSLGTGVVATAWSEGSNFATALDNNSVFLFRWTSNVMRRVYHLAEPVREIALSNSGNYLAVLSGHDPTNLTVFETGSIDPILEMDLPGNCTDLKLQKEIDSIFVRSGESVLDISDGQLSTAVSRPDLNSYTASTMVEGLFVSTEQGIFAYKTDRDSPIWEARVGNICTDLVTDLAGAIVVGYDSGHLVFIDNTDIVLGSKTGWFAVGLAVILEPVALITALNWKKIRSPKKGTLYVLVAGAFVGIAVSAVFMSESSADLLGGTVAYLAFIGIVGAISTLIAWNSAAGIGTVALGVGAGLVASVLLVLVFQFGLWYSGYLFQSTDPVFKSLINGLFDGIKTGLVGGIVGYVIQRLYK